MKAWLLIITLYWIKGGNADDENIEQNEWKGLQSYDAYHYKGQSYNPIKIERSYVQRPTNYQLHYQQPHDYNDIQYQIPQYYADTIPRGSSPYLTYVPQTYRTQEVAEQPKNEQIYYGKSYEGQTPNKPPAYEGDNSASFSEIHSQIDSPNQVYYRTSKTLKHPYQPELPYYMQQPSETMYQQAYYTHYPLENQNPYYTSQAYAPYPEHFYQPQQYKPALHEKSKFSSVKPIDSSAAGNNIIPVIHEKPNPNFKKVEEPILKPNRVENKIPQNSGENVAYKHFLVAKDIKPTNVVKRIVRYVKMAKPVPYPEDPELFEIAKYTKKPPVGNMAIIAKPIAKPIAQESSQEPSPGQNNVRKPRSKSQQEQQRFQNWLQQHRELWEDSYDGMGSLFGGFSLF